MIFIDEEDWVKFNKWITIALFISPLTMAQKDYTNSIGMEFVYIPSGTFTMRETPIHLRQIKMKWFIRLRLQKRFTWGSTR